MGLAKVKKFGFGIDGRTLELVIAIPKDSYLNEFWVANQNDIKADNSTRVGTDYIKAVQNIGDIREEEAFHKLFIKIGDYISKETGNPYDLYKLNQDCPWVSETATGIGIKISQNDLTFLTMKVLFPADVTDFKFPERCKCGEDDLVTVFPIYNLLAIRLRALSFAQFMRDDCVIPADFIDKILQIKAVELAVLSCDYYKAATYWNKFYKGKNIVTNKRCGCHDKKFI